MRWIWGGGLCALVVGGCAHEETAAQPVASNEPQQQQAWRQPVAGHESGEGAVLTPKGKYQVKQGEYQSPQGEYFHPQGIYGTRGKITTEGDVIGKGTFGTYTKPEGTFQKPTGLKAESQGPYFRAFGSSEVSERQPVAGHDEGMVFVRGESGKTWGLTNPKMISRLEQKLTDQGSYSGEIDGKAGPKLTQGVLDFQQKQGLPATGIIDPATAKALGIDFEALRGHKMAPPQSND